jgi:hypothetical protein
VTKMAKLKITGFSEDKLVKVTVELPASVHRDLVAYAEILAAQSGQSIREPNKLIPQMLSRFMATDRAFIRSRKLRKVANG